MKRRKRSRLSRQDCLSVFEAFARQVQRFGETDGGGMFQNIPDDQINIQLAIRGNFGSGDDFFEAIRVLAGHKLPRSQSDAGVKQA